MPLTYKTVPIGALGYTTKIVTAPDGSFQLTGTDGAGIWRREGTSGIWLQPIRRDNSPAELIDMKPALGDSDGTWEVLIGPNSTTIYTSYRHRWIKSLDRGLTWALCAAVPAMLMNSNAQENNHYQRLAFGKAAVDPFNSNVVYWAPEGQGLHRSLDGMASYSKITAIPDPVSPYSRATNGDRYCLIVIDPTSTRVDIGTANERHSVVYVASIGNGIYRSSDGGETFIQISSTFLYPANLQMIGGVLWLFNEFTTGGAFANGPNIYSYNGTWSAAFGPTGTAIRFVAVDPTDPTIIYGGKFLYRSNNSGETWSDIFDSGNNGEWVPHDAPLLANRRNLGKDTTSAQFSVADGKIFWATGLGICYIDAANFRAATKVAPQVKLLIHEDTAGIENIVPQQPYINANGTGFMVNQDVSIIRTTFDGTYPELPYPPSELTNGYAIDEAADDPNWLAAHLIKNTGKPSYSTDDGRNWQEFPVQPTTWGGGSLAVGNKGNVVVFPGQNGSPRVTLDTGATWADCIFASFPTGVNVTGWGFGLTSPDNFQVTADKQNPGTFYAYNYGAFLTSADSATKEAQRQASAGVWKSVDSGRNWARVSNSTVYGPSIIKSITGGQHNQLRMKNGILWLCAGMSGAGPYEPDGNDVFWRSTNNGVDWQAMPAMDEVNWYGFTKPRAGNTYPALFVIGYVGGVRGLYRCENADEATITNCTWTLLDASLRVISEAGIGGDPTEWSHLLIGYGGMGYEELRNQEVRTAV